MHMLRVGKCSQKIDLTDFHDLDFIGRMVMANFDTQPKSKTAAQVEVKTLSRVDLAEAVYKSVGLSRVESARFVDDVLNEISDALARGESVKLSSFGSLLVRIKTERAGRNPKTGVDAVISARRVVVFRPSNILKAQVNGESTENITD